MTLYIPPDSKYTYPLFFCNCCNVKVNETISLTKAKTLTCTIESYNREFHVKCVRAQNLFIYTLLRSKEAEQLHIIDCYNLWRISDQKSLKKQYSNLPTAIFLVTPEIAIYLKRKKTNKSTPNYFSKKCNHLIHRCFVYDKCQIHKSQCLSFW